MKFFKIVNKIWVEVAEVNDYDAPCELDRLAYKLGYIRIYSAVSHRATRNVYYIADCAKAKSNMYSDIYNYSLRSYIRDYDVDNSGYIYFSMSQEYFDKMTNTELYKRYSLRRCEGCGRVEPHNYMRCAGRKHFYCQDCIDNHAQKCDICGHYYMKRSSLTEYNLIEYEHPVHVCNHCKATFERNLFTCADCGGLTRNAYYIMGSHYCCNCYNSHEVPDLISGYHCGRMPITFQYATGETEADDVLKMGTEVETECNGIARPRDVAYSVNKVMNDKKQLCKFETDSSLTKGVEIITQPGTPAWYYEASTTLQEFFKTLNDNGCSYKTSGGNETCGLHIHLNRSFFKDYDYENRFCYLFQLLQDKIRIFSQRNKFTYCHFATGTTSWRNIYDMKKSQMQGHGSALNCSNRDTIELRIFRGTTDFKTYMACIEFARNLATYVRDITDIATIEKTTFDDVINYCDNVYLNDYCTSLGLLGGAR